MKKIAIVTDSINSGGIARVALTLKSLFKEMEHKCTIYSVYDHDKSIDCEDININSKQLSYLHRLYDISKKIGNNYTHVFILTMGKLSVSFSLFNLIYKRKTYICEHISFESYPYWLRCLKRITYYSCRNVIVLTRNDCELLQRRNLKVYCIQNPSPFDVIEEHRTINEKRYLVVGHLIPRKGCFRMLDVWKRYKDQRGEGTLTFSGDGALLSGLVNFVAKHNISGVSFLGATDDIVSVYEKHDVLLCTSFSEGLPMTFIEAQSLGLPVISYDIKTGPAEIILNEKNGYLVNNDDHDIFVSKMFDIENNYIYQSMSKFSLGEAVKYSKNEIYKQWSKLLNEC